MEYIRFRLQSQKDAYRVGKLRAIGVANFLEGNFKSLLRTAEIIPAVNQIETHVFRQQKDMKRLLAENGTVHEAWSPLACGQNGFFSNETVKSIGANLAGGKNLMKVAADMRQDSQPAVYAGL